MNELLQRIEEQAIKIAELEKSVAYLRPFAGPEYAEQIRQETYDQMARGNVNCGQYFGCCLAQRMLNVQLTRAIPQQRRTPSPCPIAAAGPAPQ